MIGYGTKRNGSNTCVLLISELISCVLLISEFRYQHNYEPLQHHYSKYVSRASNHCLDACYHGNEIYKYITGVW